jgi:hypothetical protein
MSSTASDGFDLRDPAFLANPHAVFDRLHVMAGTTSRAMTVGQGTA